MLSAMARRWRRRSLRYYGCILLAFWVLRWVYHHQWAITRDPYCEHSNALSFVPDGDTPDVMCQYAHLKLLEIQYDVQVGVLQMTHDLLSTFPDLSLPQLTDDCLKKAEERGISLQEALTELATSRRLERSAMITTERGQSCDLSLLWPYRDLMRREFTWSSDMQEYAQQQRGMLLASVRSSKSRNNDKHAASVVGVHVARLEEGEQGYGFTLDDLLPLDYYVNAFEYIRERYSNPVFIIVSEDPEWCKRHLLEAEIVIAEYGEPLENLALLSDLSVLVTSHGMVGVWATLMATPELLLYPARQSIASSHRYPLHHFLDTAGVSGAVAINFEE